MSATIRWGIIGTGFIAHQFARGLAVLNDAMLLAVASRTKESADKFAEEFDVTHRHVSVKQLAANEDVDVVYVALAQMVYQREPTRISGMAHLGKTGVDEQSSVTLGYDNGALAVLTSANLSMSMSLVAHRVDNSREMKDRHH